MNVHTDAFGSTPDGREVSAYTLTSSKGLRARIANFGAILVEMVVPDRHGSLGDIVLGFDALEGYLNKNPHFGGTVGRFANRIAKARFTLDGTEYALTANEGENHLHGGNEGFDRKLWEVEEATASENQAWVRMRYVSPDGEEGYPGTLTCRVTYMLTNEDELRISYEAETDKKTVVNLTNHSYWNLAGQGNGDILGHEMQVNSTKFTMINTELLPIGSIASVIDTPLDFMATKKIGARMRQTGSGFDHNYVLTGQTGELKHCATVHDPQTGRTLEIYTTEPGVQFYTANHLDGSIVGKGGVAYPQHAGLCLETQHYPDSPNKSSFPSTVLEPGQKFSSLTVHRFGAK
jgi:aldose 1-epimerase